MTNYTGAAQPQAVRDTITALGPWFHNLHLPDGTQTQPDHPLGDFPANKWRHIAAYLPADLRGWTVLDVGCNAGYYTIELARRGARVTAIDVNPRYLEQARWAVKAWGLSTAVRFQQMQVYDLARCDAMFDLVLFMGVFYHLRYPMLGLDIVAQKVRKLMIFQSLMIPGEEVVMLEIDDVHRCAPLRTAGWPKMAFIEHQLAGDPTNWWVPNHAGILAMLRASGLLVQTRLSHELYVCAPDAAHPSAAATWNRAEFLAATGHTSLPSHTMHAYPDTSHYVEEV